MCSFAVQEHACRGCVHEASGAVISTIKISTPRHAIILLYRLKMGAQCRCAGFDPHSTGAMQRGTHTPH